MWYCATAEKQRIPNGYGQREVKPEKSPRNSYHLHFKPKMIGTLKCSSLFYTFCTPISHEFFFSLPFHCKQRATKHTHIYTNEIRALSICSTWPQRKRRTPTQKKDDLIYEATLQKGICHLNVRFSIVSSFLSYMSFSFFLLVA